MSFSILSEVTLTSLTMPGCINEYSSLLEGKVTRKEHHPLRYNYANLNKTKGNFFLN
jgi:hypothetical protein